MGQWGRARSTAEQSQMTQIGGPAAINGFLYQILHHIDWLASVRLTGTFRGHRIDNACLVLEPRDGGDAKASATDIYLVEQYKTRSGRTWSLSELIDVLANLRKAVHPSYPPNARYRFVTNGAPGRLNAFHDFLTTTTHVRTVDDLDDSAKHLFGPSLKMTHRSFFDHIEALTRGHGANGPAASAAMLHLLSHFEMKFHVDGNALMHSLDTTLRQYAPDLGQVTTVRDTLVGTLLRTLAEGDTHLYAADIDALLLAAGLSPERARRLARLHRTMTALTADRLHRLTYQPCVDVRQPPKWPTEKPVMLIAGESGVGKTWQLGKLLASVLDEDGVATIVPRARHCRDLLDHAANDIWQFGLGETSPVTIQALVNHLSVHDSAPKQLTVALDDVRDPDVARDLVHQDWSQWRMRLALTVPDTVAKALHNEDAVCVHPVTDFTADELSQLLSQQGYDWIDLPADLKKILRRPILAGILLQLPYASFPSAPNTEYEIFERFWGRIAERGHAQDGGVAIELGAHVLESNPYPVPFSARHRVSLSEEALERLTAAGWLRQHDGFVAFAHDRLLNWAAAKSLATRFAEGQLTEVELATILTQCVRESTAGVPRRLGYVPMDVFWLLAQTDVEPSTLARLVARLEESREFGSYGEILYVHLLPTLGQAAVPILLERVRVVTATSAADYRVSLLAKGFAALAEQETVSLEGAIGSLLHSPTDDCQNVALAALAKVPIPGTLDEVWQLHEKRRAKLSDRDDFRSHDDYQATFAALRTGIAQDPCWLRRKITSADVPQESFPPLVFQLNALDAPTALDIWRDTRDLLIQKTPAAKPRGLLHCIARFADGDMRDFVLRHISRHEDFAGSAALVALSVIDADLAIDQLGRIDEPQLTGFRGRWLPALLRTRPEPTRQRLLALAQADGQGFRRIANLFAERPNRIDPPILRFLLRTLECELFKHLEDILAADDPIWTSRRFDFLSRITRPELLSVLEAEAGGKLELMIASVACSRVDKMTEGIHDRVFETARLALLLMGGSGINTVIRRQIESEDRTTRVNALDWASLCHDPDITERVAEIAARPVAADAPELAERADEEFYRALVAMAHLGADEPLVDALHRAGKIDVPPQLAELRAHHGPLRKNLTRRTTRFLRKGDVRESDVLIALVVAWLSADPDMIPVVRPVLQASDPASHTARYACLALQQLGDRSDEFARLAAPLLHAKDNADFALSVLSSMGANGCPWIYKWLRSRPASMMGTLELEAIGVLYANPATRKPAVAIAVDCCRHACRLPDPPWDIAAESADIELRERILDAAFASNTTNPLHVVRAIKGLAKFNVPKAVDAIRFALQYDPNVAQRLCSILASITPESSAQLLVQAALFTDHAALRDAIGRALRRLDIAPVADLLVDYINIGNANQRLAAIQVARWLPAPPIAQAVEYCADADDNSDIRLAAVATLDAHDSEATVRQLLSSLTDNTEERQWRLLFAALHTGDPHLMSDTEDGLYLGKVLAKLPAAFKNHADCVLRQRLEKARRHSRRVES